MVAGSLGHSEFFEAVEVAGLLGLNAVGDSAWDPVSCRVFAVDECDDQDSATRRVILTNTHVDWEVEGVEPTIRIFFFLPHGGPALDCAPVVSKR